MLNGLRPSVPLKMTSIICWLRRDFADISPRAQRIESEMFDLPHPFEPGIADVQPVLPRARKHRKVEIGGRNVGRQPAHQLVRVFANAGAVAQGRAVIDQRAHLFKSFGLSILYRI